MRRDLLLVLIALTALALIGVVIADWWGNDPRRAVLGEKRDAARIDTTTPPDAISRSASSPTEPEVRPPVVRLITERQEYAEWYRQHQQEPDIDARSPEGIDFSARQVLLILWGDKPGRGHSIRVERVETREDDTIVTVVTRAPQWVEDPAIVYPGVTAVVPRGRPVRLLITGERMRSVTIFTDFQPMRTLELEVDVKAHEPRQGEP